MSSLKKRLITSAFFVSVTIASIFWAPEWFFALIVGVFNVVGLNEFLTLAEKKDIPVQRIPALTAAVLLTLAVYLGYPGLEGLILALACLAIFIFNFRPPMKHALVSTAVTMFGIVYVPWFFLHLIKIKYLVSGPCWVFYTILVVKGGDAAAYFAGVKYGKTKLIERISPNKSVEGAIAGFVASIALSLLSKIYLPHAPFLQLVFLGALIGILSQFGDLAESLIKRDVGVKDSGQIPGLGGILDVLDSLILTVPFVYYYVLTFIF